MTELTRYTLKEVAKQDGKNGNNTWIVIYDKVYDVTTYRNKHPGGEELLEEYAGQDATRGFDEFGHSSDARRVLKKFLIGELVEEEKISNRRKKDATFQETTATNSRRRLLSILCGKCIT
ncbi:Cytochrome b5 [Anthophora retusa]